MSENNNGGSYIKAVIVIFFAICMLLSTCSSDVSFGEDEWHKCLKCDGTGKVRETYAYVTCPRCDGVGALYY